MNQILSSITGVLIFQNMSRTAVHHMSEMSVNELANAAFACNAVSEAQSCAA